MSDNVTTNLATTSGAKFATALVTFSGDADAHVQMVGLNILSGSEGSWTMTQIVGGAGSVGAGVQRVTLASDDPAVALLGTMDADTGGMLTALQVIDDWDESDRAKVNPIVGQAGIAAGAGAVGATVPRVTLASDDPGVALLTTIDSDTGSIKTAVELIDDAIYTDGTGTPSKGIAIMASDGTNPQFLACSAAGVLSVAAICTATNLDIRDLSSSQDSIAAVCTNTGTFAVQAACTNAGTFATQITGDALTALQLIDNCISGSEAQVDIVAALPAGTNLLGKVSIDQVTANANEVVVKSITAGDNNIGNVDIVSLPSGNVGMQAMSASLSVVPASNITDATYIGDIKFGESLPAGTAAIGKLAANNGVDIGDVDVTSIAAGTNTIGGVISQPSASTVYDGTTSCAVKRFMVVTSTDGADLIAAVADKKFRILSFAIFATATTATAFWLEDSDGADVFGDSTGITLDIDGGSGPAGLVLNHNPYGWWQTATANKDLHIKLTAAQKVVVSGTYIEVS